MRILFFFIVMLASCKHNDDLTTRNNFTNADVEFWSSFKDPNLSELIVESLTNNADILIAINNISIAQAKLNISKAEVLPNVNAQASSLEEKDSQNMVIAFPKNSYSTYRISALFSYQIDLWQKIANANKAAKEELLALDSTKKTVEITVASQVAESYFNIVSLKQKIEILEKLIALENKLHLLNRLLFQQGIIDNGSLQLSTSSLDLVKIELLELKQQLIKQESSLSVLVGRKADIKLSTANNLYNISNISTLPSSLSMKLLAERPDVIASEAQLRAAGYKVEIARANYLPDISLNALLGFSASNSNNIFESNSSNWSLGINALAPLLDYGKTRANIAIASAKQKQCLITYQHTINQALAEVITSLTEKNKAEEVLKHTNASEKSLAISNDLIAHQFKLGSVDKMILIESQKKLYLAQLNTISSQQAKLNSVIQLFKSLGGKLQQ